MQPQSISVANTSLNPRNESFKVVSGILNVQQGRSRVHVRIGHNHHNVGVLRKGINKGGKSRVAHFHALELGLGLATGELELLDNVRDL